MTIRSEYNIIKTNNIMKNNIIIINNKKYMKNKMKNNCYNK